MVQLNLHARFFYNTIDHFVFPSSLQKLLPTCTFSIQVKHQNNFRNNHGTYKRHQVVILFSTKI